MPNHAARSNYGHASLAARIPSPLQRETARDAVRGAIAMGDTAAPIIRDQRKRIAELEAALKTIVAVKATPITREFSRGRKLLFDDYKRIARAALAKEK